jgi:5-methylcytosine-specific restriction protein A
MKTLKPGVQMLNTSVARTVAATERPRGDAWMRKRDRILRRDCGLCQCDECKASTMPLLAHQVDHIVELADGGSNEDANLRAINRECHRRKTLAAERARAGR